MRSSLRVVVLLLTVVAGTARASDFEDAVRERLSLYEAVSADPAGVRAALAGRFEVQHEKLESVVPDPEKTAADHFVIGNMLYDVDPERSFAHHRAAWDALPDEPLVWIEMAYQHHRRGECDEALTFYERAAAQDRLHPPQYALLAHCLVRVGRHAEAIEAWRAAEHASRHTAVDFAIHDVFGDVSPLARHDQLAKRVLAGERAAVGELFDNALTWRSDWWNGQPNREAFDAARDAVERGFGADDPLTAEIRIWEASLEAATPEALGALLAEHGWILGEGGLPRSSFVARKLLVAVAQQGLASVADLAARFRSEVEQRARGAEPDPDALFLLGAFVAEAGTPEELREIDRYGWKRYHDADFAFSLISARRDALGEAFAHDDPLLLEAVADFPDDPRFARISALRAIQEGAATPDHVARLIDAEYHGLRSDDSRGSTDLKGYYAELARHLGETTPAAPAE